MNTNITPLILHHIRLFWTSTSPCKKRKYHSYTYQISMISKPENKKSGTYDALNFSNRTTFQKKIEIEITKLNVIKKIKSEIQKAQSEIKNSKRRRNLPRWLLKFQEVDSVRRSHTTENARGEQGWLAKFTVSRFPLSFPKV